VYGATKAALIGATRTWALELAQYNIHVNAIGPGPIATELFTAVNPMDSPRTKAIINGIPLKRMGQPEDVANLILFLASDESSFITGQVIFICGGLTVGWHTIKLRNSSSPIPLPPRGKRGRERRGNFRHSRHFS